MEPHLVLFADVRDLVDRIESAQDGRARGGRDEKRDVPPGFSLQYEALQLGRYHVTPIMREGVKSFAVNDDDGQPKTASRN